MVILKSVYIYIYIYIYMKNYTVDWDFNFSALHKEEYGKKLIHVF